MKNKLFLFVVFGAFGFAVFTLCTNVRKAKSELSNYSFYSSENIQSQGMIPVSATPKQARRTVSNSSDAYIVENNLATSSSNHLISKGTMNNSAGWQPANLGSGAPSHVNKNKLGNELSSSNNPIIIGAGSQSKKTGSGLAASSSSMSGSGLTSASHFNKVVSNSESLTGNEEKGSDPGTDPNSTVPLGNGSWILISLIFLYTLFVVKKK